MANKYELLIKTNYYKELGQSQGNGVHKDYVVKSLDNGESILAFYFRGQFYFYVGPGEERRMVEKKKIEVADLQTVERNPDVFFSYVDPFIDWYIETCITEDNTAKCLCPAIDK